MDPSCRLWEESCPPHWLSQLISPTFWRECSCMSLCESHLLHGMYMTSHPLLLIILCPNHVWHEMFPATKYILYIYCSFCFKLCTINHYLMLARKNVYPKIVCACVCDETGHTCQLLAQFIRLCRWRCGWLWPALDDRQGLKFFNLSSEGEKNNAVPSKSHSEIWG